MVRPFSLMNPVPDVEQSFLGFWKKKIQSWENTCLPGNNLESETER